MVVRLKDLEEGGQPKKGVVRLSDLTTQSSNKIDTAKTREQGKRIIASITPGLDAMKSPQKKVTPKRELPKINPLKIIDDANAKSTYNGADEEAKWNQEHGRNLPVIGPVLRGVDAAAKFVKPATDIAETLYTPGAGLSVLNLATNSAGALVSRLLPALGKSLGGRVAKIAAQEAIVGAPTGVGNQLARDPESTNKQLLEAGAYGAGGGAVLGGLGKLAGEGIQAGVGTLQRKLAGTVGALDSAGREALPTNVKRGGILARSSEAKGTAQPLEPNPTVSKYAGERKPLETGTTTVPESAPAMEQTVTEVSSAAPDVKPPSQRPSVIPGQRRFITTLQESGKLSDEISQGLSESAARTYGRLSNKVTVASANRRIVQGIDQEEASLMGKTKFSTEDVATGMRLVDELQKSGNTQRAVTIAENLAKQLTEAGQTVQAASIWNRLTAEGALVAATRKVSRINKNLLKGQTPVKISDKQADDIMDAARTIQASGASKERAANVIDITDRMRKGESVSAEDTQALADFVADAKRFLKPSDGRPPRPARVPREMTDKRVRDRVTSFLEAQEQAAKERLRAKGINISSNPIDVWADMAYIGALKIAKGTIRFTDFSEQMLKEVGDSVRPYLRQIYEKSQDILHESAKKITDRTTSKAELIAENFIKEKQKTLPEEDIKLIRNMAQKVSSLSGDEQRIASQELQGIMNGFEQAGVGRKLAAMYYIALLLRPISQIRNVTGNELLYRLERLSRIVATPIDIAISKLSGGPRTVTFKSGPAVWDDYFTTSEDFAKGLIEGGKAGAKGINPEGLSSKYEIGGLSFKSKYNPLTYMEKALGATMKGFDYAAYTRATNQRLREMAYLDALNSGIKGADNIREHMMSFMVNMDDEVHNIARKYGEYATLQDDTLLSRKLTNFRSGANELIGGNKDFGIGSLIIPFAKTPANLLMRGMEYTPIGILKAMKETHDILRVKNVDLTRADVISTVSRSIIGSGMGAVAYWLADKGALFGQSNDDSETRKLQQMTGIRDFQINGSAVSRMMIAAANGGDIDAAAKIQVGDTLWGYEWAQPTSMPMAIGSNIYQGTKKKQGALQTTGEAALAGIGTLLDSSVLSGLREAFQVQPNEPNQFKGMAMNILKQVPGMFTPALARDINTIMDNKVRENYSPNEWDAYLNPTKANIPGLADKLPQRVNTLGQPQTRVNNIFDVFVSPAARSKYQPTPEAQFVLDLLNETGDTKLAPRAVDKYIKGRDRITNLERKVNLSAEQYVRLQTVVGQETAKRIMKINPNLSTEKKIEKVITAMDEAGRIGRNELKRGLGIKPAK